MRPHASPKWPLVRHGLQLGARRSEADKMTRAEPRQAAKRLAAAKGRAVMHSRNPTSLSGGADLADWRIAACCQPVGWPRNVTYEGAN